jgi:hypothetical protein
MGFHYLLLLPLLLLQLPRRWPFEVWSATAAALLFFLLTFRGSSNLRYAYPALALVTIPLAWLFASVHGRSRPLYRALVSVSLAVFLLNVYFLPASGWYHKDFILNALDPSSKADYLVRTAPVRPLIEYMNRKHPGAPVMLVESGDIAGLQGAAYSTSWHHHSFQRELLQAGDGVEILRLLDRRHLRYFIAPNPESGIAPSQLMLEAFLQEFTEPEYRSRTFSVVRLIDKYAGAEAINRVAKGLMILPPGVYDDLNPKLSFTGRWLRDRQFPNAAAGTLTYSDHADDLFRLTFQGGAITYVYTRALNRGIAEIRIDGKTHSRLDQFAAETAWQTASTFENLGPGNHTFEVRVTSDKNPQSSGYHVDVDRIVIR